MRNLYYPCHSFSKLSIQCPPSVAQTSQTCTSTLTTGLPILTLHSFYFDGHTRNPHRWLLPSAQAEPLCLYSLQIPHSTSTDTPSPTSLILNPTTTDEKALVDALRRRLFPGCIIRLPVNYWTRTTEPLPPRDRESLATASDTSFRGVMDDYLRRERAIKTVVFASLKLRSVSSPDPPTHFRATRLIQSCVSPPISRPSFFADPSFPRLLAANDPLAGPVSGMIEERQVHLFKWIFPYLTPSSESENLRIPCFR
jgi:hypothetical protein